MMEEVSEIIGRGDSVVTYQLRLSQAGALCSMQSSSAHTCVRNSVTPASSPTTFGT